MISLAVAAAGWVLLVTRRLRRYPISTTFETPPITVVAGNVPLDLTARNARIICEMAGRTDIKVFAGAAGPLVGETVTA